MKTLTTARRTYAIPPHHIRIVIARLVELADCAVGALEQTADTTVGERVASGLAYVSRALRCEHGDELMEVTADEVKRFGGGKAGAAEVYLNVMALQSWCDGFYGPLSLRLLCEEHQDLAYTQANLSDAYAEADDAEGTSEGDSSVTITETQLNAASLFGKPNITRQ